MHKFGNIYLTEGRKLAVAIASFVNKSRYSTAIKQVNRPNIDIALFETSLPVTLTPKMTSYHKILLKLIKHEMFGFMIIMC